MSKYVEPIPVRAMVDIFRKLMVRFVDLENGIPRLYCAFDIARCLDYTSPIDAINKQCIDANVLCIIPNDKVPNRSCTKKVHSVRTNRQRALSVWPDFFAGNWSKRQYRISFSSFQKGRNAL